MTRTKIFLVADGFKANAAHLFFPSRNVMDTRKGVLYRHPVPFESNGIRVDSLLSSQVPAHHETPFWCVFSGRAQREAFGLAGSL